jgi:hypothetical protein
MNFWVREAKILVREANFPRRPVCASCTTKKPETYPLFVHNNKDEFLVTKHLLIGCCSGTMSIALIQT